MPLIGKHDLGEGWHIEFDPMGGATISKRGHERYSHTLSPSQLHTLKTLIRGERPEPVGLEENIGGMTPGKIVRWDKAPHSKDSAIADGPWGRYYIRRRHKGSREFVATLNGNSTNIVTVSIDSAKLHVEERIREAHPEYV